MTSYTNISLRPGKIYILRNPFHKEALIKIGRTAFESEKRALQISSGTGIPYPFEVLFDEDVVDCELAEKLIHEKLHLHRVNPKREFFQLPLKQAVRTVFETCLFVNKSILQETSRIVIFMNDSAAGELKNLLEPCRGGTTTVYLIFENNSAKVELILNKDWLINCSAELIVNLKLLPAIDDVIVTIPSSY